VYSKEEWKINPADPNTPVVAEIFGKIDKDDEDTFRAELSKLVNDYAHVIINLTNTEHVFSTGLKVLLDLRKMTAKSKEKKEIVIVAAPSSKVAESIGLSGLEWELNVVGNVAAAAALFPSAHIEPEADLKETAEAPEVHLELVEQPISQQLSVELPVEVEAVA
jgi:anti-anti-sigma factor